MFQTKISSERQNLARLIGAQFVVLVSLVIQLLVRPTIDIVPIFASLSILSVVVSMLTDGFFGVTDWGHEWVFQQMEDAYIIVDSLYGYLDANASAKAIFPGLERAKIGGNISKELQCIFSGENDKCEVGGRIYERKVSKIINRNKLAGYSMLLKDITEQQEHVNLIHSYNAKLEAEVEEKTRHLQLMQDSIITGMASVVESRDNSTGGHINRTSAVVKILAKKLMESPELAFEQAFLSNVIKVAPMHDLGKVAVDDVVLRKPGKFTDEEYAKMKTHSAEGARVLKKVLAEVEDTELVETAVNIAHYHHERWDGKGYPEGLEGENIPVEARIMALADVFDALVSKRCYKEAFTFDKAFSIIDEGLGTQFDPVLGKIFIDCRPELESLYMEMD
ncbi:MAG: HD domain-containing protein [Lachnospiraceae bacterium]|nr:HD domain-containing protein [Lachnospiraceae bacterium]